MTQSASETDTPNFFFTSSAAFPSNFASSRLRTPAASFSPSLFALTQACRVILNPKGSLKTTTGCKWPMTRNLQPRSGGAGQAWPWNNPTESQRTIPLDLWILTEGGVKGSRLPSWFPGTTSTSGMISTSLSKNSGTYFHSSSSTFETACFTSPNSTKSLGWVSAKIFRSFSSSRGTWEGTCIPWCAKVTSQPRWRSAMTRTLSPLCSRRRAGWSATGLTVTSSATDMPASSKSLASNEKVFLAQDLYTSRELVRHQL